jgi:hypothetical protein
MNARTAQQQAQVRTVLGLGLGLGLGLAARGDSDERTHCAAACAGAHSVLCYVMLWCPFNTPASAVALGVVAYMVSVQ